MLDKTYVLVSPILTLPRTIVFYDEIPPWDRGHLVLITNGILQKS